ncbi:MAG: hypothetical protein LBT97_03220 [Planctomycetota bacterium]|jgi:hypothetical protein|nr:hypothetical protein [Planctomycetota bacterium]
MCSASNVCEAARSDPLRYVLPVRDGIDRIVRSEVDYPVRYASNRAIHHLGATRFDVIHAVTHANHLEEAAHE